MPLQDQRKWDAKYSRGDHASSEPSELITALDEFIPRRGQAIDVAGGMGRHAIWLARRGMDVTLADISVVGLQHAERRARSVGVSIQTMHIDLETEQFSPGPWDLILSADYLYRPLFSSFAESLKPSGTLVVIQPTKTNLLRHQKPPEQFLLDDGELPRLVAGLDVVYYEEGWLREGRHEAVIVAQRMTA